MADLLEQSADWLNRMCKAHLSRQIVYFRGGDSVQIAATIGRTLFEVDDGYGAIERFESRDFLISAADLIMDGNVVQPQASDRIREVQNSKTFVYEVMSPGKEPCWRYSDAYRQMLRIHTKQVDTEIA